MKFGRAPTTSRTLGRRGDCARFIGKTWNSGKALDGGRDPIPPAATGANLSQGGEVANGCSVASRGAFGKRALPEAIGVRAGRGTTAAMGVECWGGGLAPMSAPAGPGAVLGGADDRSGRGRGWPGAAGVLANRRRIERAAFRLSAIGLPQRAPQGGPSG
jgi:hypothetical protein